MDGCDVGMGLIPSTVRGVRGCGGPAYLTGPCCGRRDWPASGRGARGGDRGRAGGARSGRADLVCSWSRAGPCGSLPPTGTFVYGVGASRQYRATATSCVGARAGRPTDGCWRRMDRSTRQTHGLQLDSAAHSEHIGGFFDTLAQFGHELLTKN